MDWQSVRKPSRAGQQAPVLQQLETCWRLRAPSARVLTCGIYRTDAPGVEVRVGFSDDNLLRSERVIEVGRAREIAEAWKLEALSKPGFSELSAEPKAAPMAGDGKAAKKR